MTRPWLPDAGAVGAVIRQHRELAQLSLRELARLSKVSNAYLSQVERGLHQPSVRVLTAIADALALPVDQLLPGAAAHREAGPIGSRDVEQAIRSDIRLSVTQQEALVAVYRSYLVAAGGHGSEHPR